MSRGNILFAGLLASAVLLGCSTTASPAFANETIRIGGTGAALAAMRILGAEFAKLDPTVEVEVLPSLGTAGGIEALAEGVIDIGLAARALKPAEAARGIGEAACLTTALVFVANHKLRDQDPRDGIRRADLPALFRDPHATWPDGAPLKIILRARSGSEYPYLIKAVPGMDEALDDAHRRQGIPVGATDQENVDMALRTKGSLAITSLLQVRAENLPLRLVRLDGVAPSAKTLADGSYPFPYRICLLLPERPSAVGLKFVSFVTSPAGREALEALGGEEDKP
ncbi:PstS family phosphate ABC transporter substrate-binding protein [Skermanella stibiiresistens]|nr:substrate-binding domain-containing protein [Skermanella stibiiresistens]